MGFTISNNFTALGGLVIVLMISAAAIVIVWIVTATRQIRHDVIEEDVDHKGPEL